MAYSILLVEDEPDTRHRLTDLISNDPEMDIIAACDCLRTAIAARDQFKPDILVTDIQLPDGLGYDLIQSTRVLTPKCAILVISVLGDETALMKAIQAGADGYLLKNDNQENIVSSIKKVLNGGSPISATMARHLLNQFSNDQQEEDHNTLLTPQENRVLSCIARGYTYRETADKLGVSHNTVPSYIKNIYQKLQVNSRGAAVYEAIRLGILDTPA